MKKQLKLADEAIIKRFKNGDDVKLIAKDADCSKATLYRRMELLKIYRKRRYPGRRNVANMAYNIKVLQEYK